MHSRVPLRSLDAHPHRRFLMHLHAIIQAKSSVGDRVVQVPPPSSTRLYGVQALRVAHLYYRVNAHSYEHRVPLVLYSDQCGSEDDDEDKGCCKQHVFLHVVGYWMYGNIHQSNMSPERGSKSRQVTSVGVQNF